MFTAMSSLHRRDSWPGSSDECKCSY